MNDIDKKIQAALRNATTGESLLAEPNLAEEVITAFRGRNRLLSTFVFVLNIGLFAVLVWAAIRFYQAESVSLQLRWGALSFVLLTMVSMIKLWFWQEMHTNRVLRELKRVELLLITRPPQP
jgi:hypothetical protein